MHELDNLENMEKEKLRTMKQDEEKPTQGEEPEKEGNSDGLKYVIIGAAVVAVLASVAFKAMKK